MKILFALLISILLSAHSVDKPLVSKEGNVTTIQIGDKIYKSSESFIGEAWTDNRLSQ